ncbi:hypothetical protein P7K49_008915 [Saguinus oedipus]|uniref:Acyltransferase C-terminal domain-containing protein n=1 Tax=Saguinus oedipus TaxID=9490 RepID=A0ABQ9VZ46_SAGOE|nr:hypothetical protein P7K49_008915 [Saguinus oedipus]
MTLYWHNAMHSTHTVTITPHDILAGSFHSQREERKAGSGVSVAHSGLQNRGPMGDRLWQPLLLSAWVQRVGGKEVSKPLNYVSSVGPSSWEALGCYSHGPHSLNDCSIDAHLCLKMPGKRGRHRGSLPAALTRQLPLGRAQVSPASSPRCGRVVSDTPAPFPGPPAGQQEDPHPLAQSVDLHTLHGGQAAGRRKQTLQNVTKISRKQLKGAADGKHNGSSHVAATLQSMCENQPRNDTGTFTHRSQITLLTPEEEGSEMTWEVKPDADFDMDKTERIPLEDIPEDDAKCSAWLHKLYQEKVSALGTRGPFMSQLWTRRAAMWWHRHFPGRHIIFAELSCWEAEQMCSVRVSGETLCCRLQEGWVPPLGVACAAVMVLTSLCEIGRSPPPSDRSHCLRVCLAHIDYSLNCLMMWLPLADVQEQSHMTSDSLDQACEWAAEGRGQSGGT